MQYLPWITLVLGLWLIASPFVLGYTDVRAAFLNDIIVGIVVTVISAIHVYLEFKPSAMKPRTV